MNIVQPMPFTEAYDFARKRGILKTDLNTYQLEELPVEVRRMAVFSATVSDARILDKIHTEIQQLAEGVSPGPGEYTNEATIRLRLKQLLESISYQASPDEAGTIKDLATDERLDLIIKTQRDMALGYGQWVQSNDEDFLLVYPAQELLRVESRTVPRGFVKRKGDIVEKEGDPGYWIKRWKDAGGRVYGGRMIARMDDPVWTRISRFGNPYPPFDFNSGYGVEPVSRRDAVALGVIEQREKVPPHPDRNLTDRIESDVSGLSKTILDALRNVIDRRELTITQDGVLTFAD